jgi:ATP-dependent exoDNAse (exonuclease V) alpha subunit
MVLGHYRLETKIVGRKAKDKTGKEIPGKQVSIIAKAAYRSGQMLKDEGAERTFNYRSRAQEVVYSEILSPEDGPEWLTSEKASTKAGTRKQRETRQRLWNTIERVEKRKDSQLAREFIASIPRGLNEAQQIELVRGWCQSEFTSKGFVVDLAVHRSKNGKNPHAHILCTTRPVSGEGFGKKPDTSGKFKGRGNAGGGAKDELIAWRASWETHANTALEKAGRTERVDRRSLKDRGIDRTPEPKIGVTAVAMKNRGVEADPRRFQMQRRTRLLNSVRPFLRSIQKSGEVRQHGMGSEWWEKPIIFLERVREQTAELVKNTWQKMLDLGRSRRTNEPDISR